MVWHVAYSFKVVWLKIESFIYLQNSPHAYLPLENTFTVMNSFSSFICNIKIHKNNQQRINSPVTGYTNETEFNKQYSPNIIALHLQESYGTYLRMFSLLIHCILH